jgi:hypothetical protein
MTVYVDDMRAPYGRLIMCHMIADTSDELLAMARKIGVATKWLQKAGTPREHFDICLSKRAEAVAAGAVEITWRELAMKTREKRIELLKERTHAD